MVHLANFSKFYYFRVDFSEKKNFKRFIYLKMQMGLTNRAYGYIAFSVKYCRQIISLLKLFAITTLRHLHYDWNRGEVKEAVKPIIDILEIHDTLACQNGDLMARDNVLLGEFDHFRSNFRSYIEKHYMYVSLFVAIKGISFQRFSFTSLHFFVGKIWILK